MIDEDGEVNDVHNGIADLIAFRLKTHTSPLSLFKEDASCLFRISADYLKYGFPMSKTIKDAIQKFITSGDCKRLHRSAPEMFCSGFAHHLSQQQFAKNFAAMCQIGILQALFPMQSWSGNWVDSELAWLDQTTSSKNGKIAHFYLVLALASLIDSPGQFPDFKQPGVVSTWQKTIFTNFPLIACHFEGLEICRQEQKMPAPVVSPFEVSLRGVLEHCPQPTFGLRMNN